MTTRQANILQIVVVSGFIVLLFLLPRVAFGQEHHAMGHADYSGWSSEKTANCYNNEDCGDLEDTQWRATPTGDQILIKGKWCPVETKHYTKTGKSSDWRKAHACVNNNPNYSPAGGDDCERLLCFMGNGGV